MRNHRKVRALRNKFGQIEGYAFWAMMLEYLTGLDGNEMEYNNMECEMFAAELGLSGETIKEMIEFCIKIELLFNKNGFIHSISLDEELNPVYIKRKKAKEASAARRRKENGTFDSLSNSLGQESINTPKSSGKVSTDNLQLSTEIPQSRVEESRVEESKIDIGQKHEIGRFEDFWNLYGKKVGLKKCKKKWENIKNSDKIKIFQTLEKWKTQFSDKNWLPNPEKYINGERWNDEIILPKTNGYENHQKNGFSKKIAEPNIDIVHKPHERTQ